MKVALVHDYLREYGGAERVLEALHEMFPQAPVYTSYYLKEKMPELFKNWDIRSSKVQSWWGINNHFLLYTYFIPWAFEQFDLKEYDLIISSSSYAAKGVISHPGQIHIDYCHTPTRFLWGINRNSNRKFVHSLLALVDNFFRQWDFAAAQRVDYFIANSKGVQTRIKKFYQRDSEVIYPFAPAPGEKLRKNDNYFLIVSRLEKLKNNEFIIKAFNQLGLPLKVLGTGSQADYLKSIAKSNIEFLGYQEDALKVELYAGCKALIVATENEDFGMTVPEVYAQGRPVIALRSGGYLESVIENETGIFFDDLTVEAIVEVVKGFENIKFDSEVIRRHSQAYSKDVFIEKMNAFIEKAVSENSK